MISIAKKIRVLLCLLVLISSFSLSFGQDGKVVDKVIVGQRIDDLSLYVTSYVGELNGDYLFRISGIKNSFLIGLSKGLQLKNKTEIQTRIEKQRFIVQQIILDESKIEIYYSCVDKNKKQITFYRDVLNGEDFSSMKNKESLVSFENDIEACGNEYVKELKDGFNYILRPSENKGFRIIYDRPYCGSNKELAAITYDENFKELSSITITIPDPSKFKKLTKAEISNNGLLTLYFLEHDPKADWSESQYSIYYQKEGNDQLQNFSYQFEGSEEKVPGVVEGDKVFYAREIKDEKGKKVLGIDLAYTDLTKKLLKKKNVNFFEELNKKKGATFFKSIRSLHLKNGGKLFFLEEVLEIVNGNTVSEVFKSIYILKVNENLSVEWTQKITKNQSPSDISPGQFKFENSSFYKFYDGQLHLVFLDHTKNYVNGKYYNNKQLSSRKKAVLVDVIVDADTGEILSREILVGEGIMELLPIFNDIGSDLNSPVFIDEEEKLILPCRKGKDYQFISVDYRK